MTKDKPKHGQKVIAFGELYGTVDYVQGDWCHMETVDGHREHFQWRTGERQYSKIYDWVT